MMTNFIQTKEYKRFVEFCNACLKDQYIGLCYGPAGVGKSLSARYFTKWDEISEDIHDAVPTIKGREPSVDISALSTIIYTPEVQNTAKSIHDDIFHLMYLFSKLKQKSLGITDDQPNNLVKLLIIDEADRLQPRGLEQVRDIYDRYNIGVVLIGMPGIEKRLVRFPQLYSRVGFSHAYKPLSQDEIHFILENHCRMLGVELCESSFSDHEAIAAVTRITQGNFRLINRVLKQTTRIMKVNQLSSITKDVVEAARECLVIGNV